LALFFVPVVNVFLFVVLGLVPPRERSGRAVSRDGRWITSSKWASAAAGTVLTGIVSVAFVAFGVDALGNYGWGHFVGAPFALGIVSALVFAYAEPRSRSACVAVGAASVVVASIAMIGLAQEGAICLFMAFPLTVPLGALGGAVGYALQRRPLRGAGRPQMFCSLVLLVPLVMGTEAAADREAPLPAVRTSVVVDAPRAVVWRHVVSFPPPGLRASLSSVSGSRTQSAPASRERASARGAGSRPATSWSRSPSGTHRACCVSTSRRSRHR
jgi:hypothetical protein